MKLKIVIVTIVAILIFSSVNLASAQEQPQVVGNVSNFDEAAAGSRVIYKNTSSGKSTSQEADPMGNYQMSLPEGTYDIEVYEQGEEKPVINKTAQKITTNSINNLELSTADSPLGIITKANILAPVILLLTGVFILLLSFIYLKNRGR